MKLSKNIVISDKTVKIVDSKNMEVSLVSSTNCKKISQQTVSPMTASTTKFGR